MELGHSFRIMTSRFSLVYKSLLFIGVILLMLSAITFSAVYSVIEPIIDGINNMDFFAHLNEAFRAFISADTAAQVTTFEQVRVDFEAIGKIFVDNSHNVILAASLFGIFVVIAKSLINVARFPAADVINNFMNSNSKFGFTSNLIANFKKSVSYSLVETLISIPFYFVTGLIMWGIGELFFTFSIWFGIVTMLAIFFVLLSLKYSLLILWLPMYVKEDKGVFKSLKDSIILNKPNILRYFGMYIITFIMLYAFTVFFTLVTFGFGIILCVSIFHVLFIAIEMVAYYRAKGEKYYLDSDTVSTPNLVVKDV